MIKGILTSLLFLLCISGFAQVMNFEVRGKYTRPVKQEKLSTARYMSDIIPYYPSNWIVSYISVEISATCSGHAMSANGSNDTLNSAQRNILHTIDLGADLVIHIAYETKNAATDILETRNLYYTATVVPDIEAEYSGGNQEMTDYFKKNTIDKIAESTSEPIEQAIVRFTISEEGEITNAQMARTSGDLKIDTLLLEAITHMPAWRPAENLNGIKVKQEFEFSIGVGGKGC